MNIVCSDVTRALLAFSKLGHIGPAALHSIAGLESFKSFDMSAILKEVQTTNSKVEADDSMIREVEKWADNNIKMAIENESRIISFLDPDYPALLLEKSFKNKSAILYIKGMAHSDPEKSIAIIGTREPTEHGKIIAQRITEYFSQNHWSIVSGLAIGCDTIAHKQALANHAHTVAVLAHGLHTIAPKQNAALAKKILDSGGMLVSEYPFGEEARPHNFVARDKIQAALSKAVVMVQSDLKGGSLHASSEAIRLGRILAVPYPTKLDIEAGSAKIQANLCISDGTTAEKCTLLKCKEDPQERIFTIRDRNDYTRLETLIHVSAQKGQGMLKF